jgi:hypothetical protein
VLSGYGFSDCFNAWEELITTELMHSYSFVKKILRHTIKIFFRNASQIILALSR